MFSDFQGKKGKRNTANKTNNCAMASNNNISLFSFQNIASKSPTFLVLVLVSAEAIDHFFLLHYHYNYCYIDFHFLAVNYNTNGRYNTRTVLIHPPI